MNKYVLFQMYEPYRQQLLAEHNFYIEQARKRLLAQFADFESEVEEASNAWLEKRSHTFNPDFDDAGSIYVRFEDRRLRSCDDDGVCDAVSVQAGTWVQL